MENRFYLCRHCGNLVDMIHDAGVPLVCCGEKMEALEPNAADSGGEKHLPVAVVEEGMVTVSVGAQAHPMTPEHAIEWVYLRTDRGGQRKALQPGQEPEARFALWDETPVAVYAWCSLQGLWMQALEEK